MNNLPAQPTTFVGRADELVEISRLLHDPACRLLTLVGAGGIGKTRLALQVAADQTPFYPQGVHVVFLQSVTSPDLIPSAIASTLKIQFYGAEEPRLQIINYLREKHLLLVLDNFEHLLEGTVLLTDILAAAPDVKILTTSRERLNLQEEWTRTIEGLSFPDQRTSGSSEKYEAVQLFVERARQMQSTFSLKANAEAIKIICRQVEGMPLGIELAASWLRVMNCPQIAVHMAHSLEFLTTPLRNVPERHRSIRAVFEQSWNLLSKNEQKVLMKLSVFRGGFDLEAAQAITGASLMILASLADKSLVRLQTSGRYDLHELLCQYAEEKLNASGDMEIARRTHCGYYAEFMSSRVEDLKGRRQIEALAEITADWENARAAWIRAAEHKDAHTIEKILEGLWRFCDLRNRDQERASLFRVAEQAFASEDHFERLWGRLLARGGGEPEMLQKQLETALQIAHRYHDNAEIALCIERLGDVANELGNQAKAIQLLEKGLEHYRQLGNSYDAAETLFKLMSSLMYANYDGMWEDFMRYGGESLRLRREIGDQVGISWSLAPVAQGAAREGRFAESEQLWLERIALGQKIGALAPVALSYAHISYQVYFVQGDFVNARLTAEEAVKIGTAINFLNPVGYALTTLGLLASMDGNYQQGKTLCQQAASNTSFAWIIDHAAWGSAVAACGLGDYQTINEFFPHALGHRVHMYAHVGLISCLPIVAILMAQNGDEIHAVELLALAFTHPVRASGWMEKWSLLTRLCLQLEHALGYEAYTAAWERGRLLDVDKVATEVLLQFQGKRIFSKEKAASSMLTLSERELNVLRLMGQGLSNPQIAEQLIVAIGTVKAHTNSIFGKLGVSNRVQAVTRARELHLL